MKRPPRAGVVVVAAGRGERLGGGMPKQFRLLAGKPLLLHSLLRFDALPWVDVLVVVAPPEGLPGAVATQLATLRKPVVVTAGGARRQDSTAAGLDALATSDRPFDVALVHDAARPFPDPDAAARLAHAAAELGGALLAVRSADTVKLARPAPPSAPLGVAALVERTLDRDAVWLAQTPQAIRADWVPRALAELRRPDRLYTDEAALLEALGVPTAIVEGTAENFKITTPADWARAEAAASRTATLAERA